jgi:hypothetical protein
MKNLALGLGAWSLAAGLLATLATTTARAVPEQDIAAGAGGFGFAGTGVGGAAGIGGPGMVPFTELRAVNLGAGIPVGGAILLTGAGSTTAPIVEVADQETPNTTLGGTTRQFESSQYWIWVPSQPFVEGKTYQVRLSAPDVGFFGVTDSFEVVPAITLSQPVLVAEPSASSVAETNNVACCRSFFGSGVLEQSSCFPNEQRRTIMVNPGLSTPNPAVLLGQFLFRIHPGDEVTALTQPTQWPTSVPVMFNEQADEYCFNVEAIELVSGTMHGYPDLERCAEHGALPEIGVVEIEAGASELDREICHAPPLAYEQQWCDLNEDPCADDGTESGCGLYGYVCRDEALPQDPFSGGGGFAGFEAGFGGMGIGGATGTVSGSGGDDGFFAGASGASGRGGGGGGSGSDDGCSIAGVPAKGRDAGLLAWSAFAVASLLTARRRTRARLA